MLSHLILCILICSTFSWAAPSDEIEGGEMRGGGEKVGGGGEGGGKKGEGGGGVGNANVDSTASQTTPVTTEQGGGGGGGGKGRGGHKKKEEEEEEVDFVEYYAAIADENPTLPPHPPISDTLPHFIANVADGRRLCYGLNGFELFTYNLLSTSHINVNGFVNVTQLETGEWVRGITDLGFIIKIEDDRVSKGFRVFRAVVDGRNKKAVLAGFGEVDMKNGAVVFNINADGHTSIESGEAEQEEFQLLMEQPKLSVWAVSTDRRTYNVYIEAGPEFVNEPSHGIIGQFLNPAVKVDEASGQLLLGPDRDAIPVHQDPVWDSIRDKGYMNGTCWHVQDGVDILEGKPYNYVTEYILAHKYQFSLYEPKKKREKPAS